MNRFFSSLSARLSMILVVLLLSFGGLQLLLSQWMAERWYLESEQRFHWDLARRLAERIQPHTLDHLDYAAVDNAIYDYLLLPSRSRAYLLDKRGKVIQHFGSRHDLVRERVDTKPLEVFLASDHTHPPVLLGDDPMRQAEQTIFSAARLVIEREPGYVYVVLSGETFDAMRAVLGESYILDSTLYLVVVSTAVTMAVGLLLFFVLTRRFRSLMRVIGKFEAGDFEARAEAGSSDDVGRLGRAVNRLADTVAANIQALKEKDRLRRTLVASISHDLRTPIAAVHSVSETLLAEDEQLPSPSRRRYLETIVQNIERLQKMISELFELSKLEAKESPVEADYLDFEELLDGLFGSFAQEAAARSVSLERSIEEGLPPLYADMHLLSRALGNLIDNAIRYTGEGTAVTVSAERAGSHAILTVADNGAGIAADELPYLFDQFYRAKATRSIPGTGLGLAIVKAIIARHGGTITVASTVGEGTRFIIDLPATPEALEAELAVAD